jgi:hypothetical protein
MGTRPKSLADTYSVTPGWWDAGPISNFSFVPYIPPSTGTVGGWPTLSAPAKLWLPPQTTIKVKSGGQECPPHRTKTKSPLEAV